MTSAESPVQSLEECAYQFGRTYESYLAIEPERRTFWSASGRGAFSFVADGRHVHASGGLLCPADDRPALLDQALAWAGGLSAVLLQHPARRSAGVPAARISGHPVG